MSDESGATPRELLIEACRRNNTSLLGEVLSSAAHRDNADATAAFLNTTTDALGASALHIAAQHGSYEVLDAILDQQGVEIDGQERREGDTCLHKAVRYCNGLPAGDPGEAEAGRAVVDILLDAGCDPRIRNKAKLRPIDLVDPRNSELRSLLQKAELTMLVGDDVVVEDEDERDGPGSESD